MLKYRRSTEILEPIFRYSKQTKVPVSFSILGRLQPEFLLENRRLFRDTKGVLACDWKEERSGLGEFLLGPANRPQYLDPFGEHGMWVDNYVGQNRTNGAFQSQTGMGPTDIGKLGIDPEPTHYLGYGGLMHDRDLAAASMSSNSFIRAGRSIIADMKLAARSFVAPFVKGGAFPESSGLIPSWEVTVAFLGPAEILHIYNSLDPTALVAPIDAAFYTNQVNCMMHPELCGNE